MTSSPAPSMKAGKRLRIALDGTTVGFGYDALYRLTSDSRVGSNPFSHTYGYDLAGNPTTVNGSTFATFDSANKISTIAGGSAAHDGDGNLTSISGTSVPSGSFT